MSNKKYTLVAWTDKGEVRMIPSLVNEVSQSYRDRIERLKGAEDVKDVIGWLLTRSRAHEAFARFLLRVGYPREAYVEFENAAEVCTFCRDELWVDGDLCSFPVLPLLTRFLSMHRECVRLAKEDRCLALSYEDSRLKREYNYFNLDSRETDREISEALATVRAWRFGKH